jgi:hypothetical protein
LPFDVTLRRLLQSVTIFAASLQTSHDRCGVNLELPFINHLSILHYDGFAYDRLTPFTKVVSLGETLSLFQLQPHLPADTTNHTAAHRLVPKRLLLYLVAVRHIPK